MRKKIRLLILLACVACFFAIAPILVFYSMGYRFDFKKMAMTETGGIYVRTFPAAEQIIIDSKIKERPGIFSNSIFVQSLLPDEHTVLVKKEGYYDYFKTIPVQEKQVTKLENILLFKKNIQFEIAGSSVQSPFVEQSKFIIKNNDLYYSASPENSNLTVLQKTTPIIKKMSAFSLQNNNIIWLGTDGFLYKSDSTNFSLTAIKITTNPIKILKAGSYKIISDSNIIFVDNNGSLLFLNEKTNNLDSFYTTIKDAAISPDGKNIFYYNDNNIYISPIPSLPKENILLYKSSEKVSACIWINDNYIIFSVGNKIIISEIDYRGNINTVTLSQTINISSTKNISLENPQIFFDQQAGKIYILTNKILLVSEKITY